jgi:hypothetical protein
MVSYWWVNHKQTVRQEIDGQYLWSPMIEASGARSKFCENMRRAAPGNVVLSYVSQVIGFVGRVADFGFTAPKPSDYGTAGGYWSQSGWRLPVFWTLQSPPLSPNAMFAQIGPVAGPVFVPSSPDGPSKSEGLGHCD